MLTIHGSSGLGLPNLDFASFIQSAAESIQEAEEQLTGKVVYGTYHLDADGSAVLLRTYHGQPDMLVAQAAEEAATDAAEQAAVVAAAAGGAAAAIVEPEHTQVQHVSTPLPHTQVSMGIATDPTAVAYAAALLPHAQDLHATSSDPSCSTTMIGVAPLSSATAMSPFSTNTPAGVSTLDPATRSSSALPAEMPGGRTSGNGTTAGI